MPERVERGKRQNHRGQYQTDAERGRRREEGASLDLFDQDDQPSGGMNLSEPWAAPGAVFSGNGSRL